jgi:hypothetical protein
MKTQDSNRRDILYTAFTFALPCAAVVALTVTIIAKVLG